MKFEIRITDATEIELFELIRHLEKKQEVSKKVDAGLNVWAGKRRVLTKAQRMKLKVSPEAPYGLKKDGTPRKKAGRPPTKHEF